MAGEWSHGTLDQQQNASDHRTITARMSRACGGLYILRGVCRLF